MTIITIGLDLAKSVFQVHCLDSALQKGVVRIDDQGLVVGVQPTGAFDSTRTSPDLPGRRSERGDPLVRGSRVDAPNDVVATLSSSRQFEPRRWDRVVRYRGQLGTGELDGCAGPDDRLDLKIERVCGCSQLDVVRHGELVGHGNPCQC